MPFSDIWPGERGRRDPDRWRLAARERDEQRSYGSDEDGGEDFEHRRFWPDRDRPERYGAGRHEPDDFGAGGYERPRHYVGSVGDWRARWRAQREFRTGSYPARRFFNDRWQDSYGRVARGGVSPGRPHHREWPPERYGYGTYERQQYASPPWREEQQPGPERFSYSGGVSSVTRGPFRGRGPRGYRRSDERIREDACEYLTEDDLIDASNIEVIVKECEVTLSGTVHSREEKRRAEDLVENVSGVQDVHNTLRVVDEAGQIENARAQSGQATPSTQPAQSGGEPEQAARH